MADENINGQDSRIVRLHGEVRATDGADEADSWPEAVEYIIQRSIAKLADRRTVGNHEIESTAFVKTLTETARGRELTAQFTDLIEMRLFSKPIGIFSFQLLDGQYQCIERIPFEVLEHISLLDSARNCLKSLAKMAQMVNSVSVKLEDKQTTEELLSIALDHIHEHEQLPRKMPDEGGIPRRTEWYDWKTTKVHSAKRSSLRNWEYRLRSGFSEAFEHKDDQTEHFSYPFVDARVPDGVHLLLVLMSPLDVNFVDDKVEQNSRVPEITLGLFDAGDHLYPGAVSEVVPLLKQAFARVLFTNMLKETDQALHESYEERSSIMRHWALLASSGVRGVLTEEQCKAPFDPIVFLEAIVRKVLCANIPGVERAEVYPFSRAFLFREAGSSSRITNDPMEVMVLEASILSNNPGDRGMYLTARERLLRGTEDFECSTAKKRISQEDVKRFFVHKVPHNDGILILSRQKELADGQKESILREQQSRLSKTADEAEIGGYSFSVPDLNDVEREDSHVGLAIYNLFGRLISRVQAKKIIRGPQLLKNKGYEVNTFSEEFEKLRLQVMGRFDDRGLDFHYENDIDILEEAPLLYEFQDAYFRYLDDSFEAQDMRFRQEGYRQENVPKEHIAELMKAHQEERHTARSTGKKSQHSAVSQAMIGRCQRSKVVYISFSWELHDDNTRLMNKDVEERQRGSVHWDRENDDQFALLGKEYRYSLLLVADQAQDVSMARLLSEQKDLKLFFQMIMRQIWMDRLDEREYLQKRSKSIKAVLDQFMHRVKPMLPKAEAREVDDLLANLRVLTEPRRPVLKQLLVTDELSFLSRVLGTASGENGPGQEPLSMLQAKASGWAGADEGTAGTCSIKLLPASTTSLKVFWDDAVIKDAFVVAFKNAVEAAWTAHGTAGEVTVQLQASPRDLAGDRSHWFLDVVIENTGGPIPTKRLELLTSEVPTLVEKDHVKAGSTGVGVFLTRFQLQEVIGRSADLMLANLPGGRVQCRIRLPAALSEEEHRFDWHTARDVPQSPYVLYVEDDRKRVEQLLPDFAALVAKQGLGLLHRRSLNGAHGAARLRMPSLVLSDVSIVSNEEDASLGDRKYGEALIRALVRMGSEHSSPPPIWLLTAESESKIVEAMSGTNLGAYRFVSSPEQQPSEDPTLPGTISVFEDRKNPMDIDAALMASLLSRRRQDEPSPEREAVFKPDSTVPVVTGRLEAGKFSPPLDELAGVLSDSRTIVVIEAKCTTRLQLAKQLVTWFKNEGLPDSDLKMDETRFRLNDHVSHKRLVLALQVAPNLFDSVCPKLMYWGLQNDLWFVRAGKGEHVTSPEEIAKKWMTIRNENRGPLSVLRHDLKNQWDSKELVPHLKGMIGIIDEGEVKFALDRENQRDLEASLYHPAAHQVKAVDDVENQLGHCLMTNKAVKGMQKETKAYLNRLHSTLVQAEQEKKQPLVHIEDQKACCRTLGAYLGGGA